MGSREVNDLKDALLYLLFCLAVTFTYLFISASWGGLGIGEEGFSYNLLRFEIPFILVVLGLLYFPGTRSRLIRYLAPIVILLVIYSLYDLFYSYLFRAPRPSDFRNLPLLFDFSPQFGIGLLLYASLAPLSLVLLLWHACRSSAPNRLFGYALLMRLSLLAIILLTLATEGFGNYHKRIFEDAVWSQEETIRLNGRLSSFLYFWQEERHSMRLLKSYAGRDVDIHATLYPGKPVRPRNVHMILLESFIDPRLIEGALFRPSPVSEKLRPYLLDNDWEFSHVISPEYGGGTAEVEFELLTGIKAFSSVNTVAFNVMQGNSMQSFPDRLKQSGYTAMATVASGPEYFNARRAYRSLGFDLIHFLGNREDVPGQEDDPFIFDGDLLQYNLEKFREIRHKSNGPVFNYVLGMYGHIPFERNTELRPDRIDVIHEDDSIRRIANQFYYRTEAIADFLDELLAIDPESIILISSDHLPPILGETTRYMFDEYRNIALFLRDGELVDITEKEYFEIPWIIWDMLREVDYDERSYDEKELEELYFEALSQTRVWE